MYNKPNTPPDKLPSYKTGTLPSEAPLANPFVPFQKENAQYRHDEGLTRGTIFPGLDLPWKNMVNQSNPAAGTELGEIMALEFALDELQLYLDTHMNDTETVKIFEYYTSLAKDARTRYEASHGPLFRDEAVRDGKYQWLQNPWPWDYQEKY